MKRWVTYGIKILLIVLLPILFFDVFGMKYTSSLDGEKIIEDAETKYEVYGDAFVGTEKHQAFQEELIHDLESMGYSVEKQVYKQLGTIVGDDYYLEVNGTVYPLAPVRGGRSIGTSFEGELVLLNSATSFTKELVKDRFVMLTNFGRVDDRVFETLYEYGCRGVLTGTAFYPDGFENFDISRLDGRLIPIAQTYEVLNEELIALSKASQKSRRQISIGVSYSNVDYFDGGVIENVKIKIDQSIEVIEGTNIIASLTDSKTPQIIATSYDPQPSFDDTGVYFNMLSLSTVIEMADAVKDSNRPIAFALFDSGSSGQIGAEYYHEHPLYPQSPILFIENIGFYNHYIFFKGDDSLFEAEKFMQYDQDGLTQGNPDWIDQVMINQAAYSFLQNEAQVAAITLDPTTNLFTVFSEELTDANFGNLLEMLDEYLKVEVSQDYSHNLSEDFIIVLIGFIIFMILLITIEQFKNWPMIHKLYNTHSYKIFMSILNVIGVFLVTLLVILMIALLPEYFNMNNTGFNYSFYTLSHEIISVIDTFVHQGLGLSTMGIPYSEIILQTSMVSFKLVLIAMSISVLLGLCIGLLSSYRKKTNNTQSTWVILGLSIPETVIIIGLLFSMKYMVEWPFIKDHMESTDLRTFVLPLISMVIVPTIYISRVVYIEVVELMQKKFILSLKAKGVKKNRIYTHHILPMAFQKVLHTMPIVLAINISTMIIAEKLFAVPGIVNQIFAALNGGIYLYYLGLVLAIMIFYYLVILSVKLLGKLLIPTGGANETK